MFKCNWNTDGNTTMISTIFNKTTNFKESVFTMLFSTNTVKVEVSKKKHAKLPFACELKKYF